MYRPEVAVALGMIWKPCGIDHPALFSYPRRRAKLASIALLSMAALLAAGCLQTPTTDRAPNEASSLPAMQELAISGCGQCFEPTVTWVGNDLFVATGSGKNFSVSHDGGLTFRKLAKPPLPQGFNGVAFSDVILQTDPQGSLWWSDLLATVTLDGIRVARSDDRGLTWSVNQRLSPTGPLSAYADRNWIAFGPSGQVLAACTCPGGLSPMAAVSLDRGTTFGPFLPVPAQGRPGPLGPPAWSANGIAIPYLIGGGLSNQTQVQAQGVAAVHSTDGKTWTPVMVAIDQVPAGGFPGSASDHDALYISWSSTAGGPRVAASLDGGATWSKPIEVASGATAYPNAWVAAHNGKLAVAWFAANGTSVDYRVAVGSLAGSFNTLLNVPLQIPRSPVFTRGNTDFAHVAWSDDGRLAAVWSDQGVHVRVISAEVRPGGEP